MTSKTNSRKKRNISTDDEVYNIQEYNLDLKTNEIFLFGSEYYIGLDEDYQEPGVEFSMSNMLIKNLHLCSHQNPTKPIIIHLKTNGGFWEEGMAIYDAIKHCPNPVVGINYTHARSMSSLILLACNKRVMMPNSYYMIHDGTIGVNGTLKQAYSSMEFTKISCKVMMDIYVQNARDSVFYKDKTDKFIEKSLRDLMDKKEDVYFTPEETIERGFADYIFGLGVNWSNIDKLTKKQLNR